MPVNYGEIVATTLERRRGELADNVLNHNALLRRLNERGNVDPVPGGRSIWEELEFAENQTAMWYSGYEVLNVSPSYTFDTADFQWKQAAVNVTMSGLEERSNMGREAVINLLDSRISNAEKTMANLISVATYSDGTGNGGKEIGGLKLLIADSPTTGTVGGIDRATYAFWRNQVEAIGAAVTKDNIGGAMRNLWLKTYRGTDRPDLIVKDILHYNAYWESLTEIQRIGNAQTGQSGYETLQFYGPGGRADVVYDDVCPTKRSYFVNSEFLKYRPHSDANVVPLRRRDSVNQDAMVMPVIFMGNMTLRNAQRQGVVTST